MQWYNVYLFVLFLLENGACVRGSRMVPLVGNIYTIGTNLITNGTISKEIAANGKNGNTIGTNGSNVTNQWYHCENPEHTRRWWVRSEAVLTCTHSQCFDQNSGGGITTYI